MTVTPIEDLVRPEKTCLLHIGRDKLLSYLPKGARAAEIGVYKGKFSRKILWKARPSSLLLIDAWDVEIENAHIPHVQEMKKQKFANMAKTLPRSLKLYNPFCDITALKSYSVPAAEHYADGEFDWIYIDADHSYEGAKGDLNAWGPKVGRDGIILGHDFTNQPAARKNKYGVIEAVGEYVKENGYYLLFITMDYFPSYCIIKEYSGRAKQFVDNVFSSQKSVLVIGRDDALKVRQERYQRISSKTGLISDYSGK